MRWPEYIHLKANEEYSTTHVQSTWNYIYLYYV